MSEVVINGRFLAASQTGVQRTALELTLAADLLLSREQNLGHWLLAVPPDTETPKLNNIAVKTIPGPRGTIWEQTALWRAHRCSVLVNLANTAPLLHTRSVLFLHDSQVWDSPESYSFAFRTWYRLLQPLIARKAAALVTVSEHSALQLDANGVASRSQFSIIPNGLDHCLRNCPDPTLADQLGRYVFALAGSQRHKNLDFLLELFSDPRLSDVTLALAGQTPTKLGTFDNVKFLGFVDDSKLRGLYEGAQLFVFPSTTEGFGLPPGEAMLCGCPVIAADRGALPGNYGTGALMIDPSDREAWITSIRDVFDDKAKRTNLAMRGSACVAEMTWEVAASQLIKLVSGLV